jgi:hypothetical protein
MIYDGGYVPKTVIEVQLRPQSRCRCLALRAIVVSLWLLDAALLLLFNPLQLLEL